MRRKLTCIFLLSVKRSTVLKLLEQYGRSNTCATKNDFSLSPLTLN